MALPKVPKPPSLTPSTGLSKDITKVGKQGVSVKTPKAKKSADAFSPPSVFFGKSQDFEGPKHSTLRNLWDFINKRHKST